MTKKEASELVAQVCQGAMNIAYTDHFWQRVDERIPGFSTLHAINALRQGEINCTPIKDKDFNNHKIKWLADIPDFGKVELVIGVKHFSNAVGITIYEVKKTKPVRS